MKDNNTKASKTSSLAPMAGVTDRAFREICAEFYAYGLTSEMVSVKGLLYNSRKTLDLILHSETERPFSIQLFGNDPKDFSKAAKIISEFHPDSIDINMGCPAPKITKAGAGAALMKNPILCAEIVSSVKDSTDIPVTVKIRSGWDEKSINAAQVAVICERAGADKITVHGRTAKQMYSGKSDYNIIKSVKDRVNIHVVGNGDITCAQDALNMINYTGCDSTAIGRGALGNPWIFSQVNYFLSEGKTLPPPSNNEKIRVINRHVEKICKYKGEKLGIIESRKHVAWYLKGMANAAELRRKALLIENIEDLRSLCGEIKLQ